MVQSREIRVGEYEMLYSQMELDFPVAGELAPFRAIKRSLEENIYDGFYFTKNAVDIGYALITAPEHLEYALINYFAVLPEHRSKGYGSECLKNMLRRYCGRTLVIEVEDPSAASSVELCEEAERRIKFYERAGFRVLPTKRAKIFGVDMLIMASGGAECTAPLNAREIMHALYLPAFASAEWLKRIDIVV